MTTETLIQLPDNQSLKVLFANVANPKTDPRFYLSGILVDPAGVLVATDGYAMAEVNLPEQDPALDLAKTLFGWCAAVSTKETPVTNLIIQPWKVPVRSGPWALKIDGQYVFAVDTFGRNPDTLLTTENSHGKYPDWRRVSTWGKHWKPAAIDIKCDFTLGVNPLLLARFQIDKDRPVRVIFSGNLSSMRVQSIDSEVRGTVMPACV